MLIPNWWCDENSTRNLAEKGGTPKFKESDVFEEYLRREMDDIMSFSTYKHTRSTVINIIE